MKGHGLFNLRYLLESPFTTDDLSNLTIKYNVYNEEPINIGDKNEEKFLERTSTQPTKNLNEKMEIDLHSNMDITEDTSASLELKQQEKGSSREQIVKDFLKACFENQKKTRSNVESQIHAIFLDASGMFQVIYSISYDRKHI